MKLYITCDGYGYEVSTKEPTFVDGDMTFEDKEDVAVLCTVAAEKLFPKLPLDEDEFLEIEVTQKNVWGP